MTASKSKKLKTSDMAYIALFAVVIAVCSWISVPATVPFTLQTFGIFLAVGVLGGKRGTLSVLVYLLLGIIGVPVFAGFSGGVGCILGSTGGYIVGFLFSALAMWATERFWNKSKWIPALSMILGLLICYVLGTIWFMLVYAKTTGAIGIWTALGWCVFPYIIPDIIKIILALALRKKLSSVIK